MPGISARAWTGGRFKSNFTGSLTTPAICGFGRTVSSDPLKNLKPHDLTIYYAVSYLLDQGYTPEQLGVEKITRMQEVLLKYSQRFLPMLPREQWNLSALTAKRAFSESLEFSKQVGCAPFVLGFFPTATAEPAAEPAK